MTAKVSEVMDEYMESMSIRATDNVDDCKEYGPRSVLSKISNSHSEDDRYDCENNAVGFIGDQQFSHFRVSLKYHLSSSQVRLRTPYLSVV